MYAYWVLVHGLWLSVLACFLVMVPVCRYTSLPVHGSSLMYLYVSMGLMYLFLLMYIGISGTWCSFVPLRVGLINVGW